MEPSIEQTFQKKSPVEHILIRPDSYVGSIQMEKSTKWVWVPDKPKFIEKQITFVPALFKIFDQVLVNAADNYQRDRRMNLLKVQINPKEGYISVLNNGKGIPVETHKQHNIYVPQLIFGHLLTGSNYNDNQKKVVGGRNGYGAKLANIYSKKFIVECGDGGRRRQFKMIWTKNMMTKGQADVKPYSGKDYTKITFYPDLKRFNMTVLDEDIVSFLSKRVYDMAGIMNRVKVYLNDRQITFPSFKQYVDMFFQPGSEAPKVRDQQLKSNRWEVIVSLSEGEFKQVSFVNSISTTKGGTHVNYITDQIVERVQEAIKKKKQKNLVVKPFQIKAHLWIFLNCLIENPTFDSQTKQNMTLKPSNFGSQCILSEKMIKQILNSGIVDDVYNQAKNKELNKLAKVTAGHKRSRLTGIPKLQDANEAGTRNSQKCTLILTQGDSAKSLAVAGLEVIGRNYYGVFPLKGKLLNVRQASASSIIKNQQVQSIMKIIGLQMKKKYQDLKSLRYGAIMIMSDQDTDGSHIKGLVINFIHTFWPQLFKKEGFLKQFITPLLKVKKGSQSISFYTMNDYKTWAQTIPNIKLWKIKYYKGLGTSTDKQAQEYFQRIDRNRIDFQYISNDDDDAMELIFSKKNVQRRKLWLSTYDPKEVMVYDRPKIRYKQFVDRQFIHFSNEDNIRSIANVVDGFKPGQRKILFSCFKRNLKEQIKVAQLSGYVSEHSAYHHGQMSLTQTIVGMAQTYVGSNNINLLLPNGQFGSRNQGGKDHASARYIFTNLNKVTRCIFPQPDDHTLTYVQDDGQFVEPQYYVPIIPMVLVNGCQGIGTGWSTSIPNHSPRQIIKLIINRLQKEAEFPDIHPWYKGYQGQIIPRDQFLSAFQVKGILQFDEENEFIIHVKELPVGHWTKSYKVFLDQMIQENQKIVGIRQHHSKNRVHFQLEVVQSYMGKIGHNQQHWEKLLKINAGISNRNMVAFNVVHKLQRYASAKDILNLFYGIRIQYYEKRKKYLLSKLERDLLFMSQKQRFILAVIEQKIQIRNVKKLVLCQVLKKMGFKKFCDFPKILSTKNVKAQKSNEESEEAQAQKVQEQVQHQKLGTQYNYLLNLPLWSLTWQKVQQIKRQRKMKDQQLKVLLNTSVKQMWIADLDALIVELDKYQDQEEQDRLNGNSKVKGGNRGKRMPKPRKQKQKQVSNKKQKAKDKDIKKSKPKSGKKKNISDSQSEAESAATQYAGNKRKKTKQVTTGKKQIPAITQQSNDFMARVKSKYMENLQQKASTKIQVRPVNSKKNLNGPFDPQQELQIVRAPQKSAKSSRRKNKLQLDSESQEESQQDSFVASDQDQDFQE